MCVFIGVFGIHIPGMFSRLRGDKCYEEWDRLLQYIDVIKMHGRESVSRLFETMKIVDLASQMNYNSTGDSVVFFETRSKI